MLLDHTRKCVKWKVERIVKTPLAGFKSYYFGTTNLGLVKARPSSIYCMGRKMHNIDKVTIKFFWKSDVVEIVVNFTLLQNDVFSISSLKESTDFYFRFKNQRGFELIQKRQWWCQDSIRIVYRSRSFVQKPVE